MHFKTRLASSLKYKSDISMKRSQKDSHQLLAMHFGKHCPRTKANVRAAKRPRSGEQLDTREPSRLQSSLYRILRSKVREDRGRRKGRTKTKARAKRACETCTMEKFEPIHREAHLRQRNAAKSCPTDSCQKRKWRKKAQKKRTKEIIDGIRRFRGISLATNWIKFFN